MSTATLAARARQVHATTPRGSLQRRAAGCAAVVLTDARTPAGARKMLRAADHLADDVRDAALDLIDALTKETPTDG
ncbi:hypothetical protein [Nocardiopsis protaetiae]|uniref:hypothetical protein n=1 Tax=Nocardiopsis protaetiae TaxID=3382270 RepID=UPI00387B70AB